MAKKNETASEEKNSQNKLDKEMINQLMGELFTEKTWQEIEELDDEEIGMMVLEKMRESFLESNEALVKTTKMLGLWDENNPVIIAIHKNEKLIILINALENARNQTK